MNDERRAQTPAGPVRVETLDGGAVWRVTLATPKANLVDRRKTEILTDLYTRAGGEPGLKAIVLEGEGEHFSFGASVPEHLPDQVEAMLTGFHGLFYRMLQSGVVSLAAVRGQCLGGALELASFCQRVFAAPGARFGQPEIRLGVFAPVASVFLAERVGRAAAEDLCLSGRSVGAEDAHAIGLADAVADDPAAAALAYAREHLLPHSAASLRFAARALRAELATRVRTHLARVERLYLEELMATRDAREGLEAFLAKRAPVWSDR